ncbi:MULTISPECIES: tetratricopeptide repeat protein [unclassified Crossiella]|uniref:tetratricopeptide repeat protein n=1 Tax=unclassified Crossiella TaxID=2620835 RepID=UPI0020002963|nr:MULTISPECIES: tetratricopeptide repeat protein [unclassified Crossiella]MCK2241633.1 tetratricopeptide repeat protein [Crossiella sp. S99.2]MCK2255495.1 tetratricopeptide repeat protein [Crossiella sp. S99.1]
MTDRQFAIGSGHARIQQAGRDIVNHYVSGEEPPRISPPRRVSAAARMLFGAHPPVPLGRPTTWLRPDADIVPVQPRPEVDELRRWCVSPGRSRLRLVCGRGGQGKTQLGRQLTGQLRKLGWLAGFLDAAQGWPEIEAALGSKLVQRKDTLLVVDYAENQALTLNRLADLVRRSPRVRVLLLARHEGGWWRDLVDEPAWSGLVDPVALPLGSLTDQLPPDRVRAVHGDAARCYSDRLGRPVPELSWQERRCTTTLDLYADALLQVLDAESPVRSGVPDDPVSDVLAHERRHVRQALRAEGVPVSAADLDWMLLAPYLVPAGTLAEAVTALESLPLQEKGALAKAARVLGGLYPDEAGGVWAPPRPDRLADTHVLAVAAGSVSDGDWVEAAVALCGNDGRPVRLLLRCLSTPRADPVGLRRVEQAVGELVVRQPRTCLLPVILAEPRRFEAEILQVLRPDSPDSQLGHDSLQAIDLVLGNLIPSVAWAKIAMVISARLVAETTPTEDASDAEYFQYALKLSTLGGRQGLVGLHRQALAVSEQAVAILRQLADTNHGCYLPALATALGNLSVGLATAERLTEALVASADKVRIWQTLAEENPDRFLPEFASSLDGLGLIHLQADNIEESLASAEEAVSIHRKLVSNDSAHLPGLARGLNFLAPCLVTAGRAADALAATTEAVELYWRLAADNDAYLPELASSLLGFTLARTTIAHDLPAALIAATEMVDLYQQLAEQLPQRFAGDLETANRILALVRNQL